eukprot:s254_g37.t1
MASGRSKTEGPSRAETQRSVLGRSRPQPCCKVICWLKADLRRRGDAVAYFESSELCLEKLLGPVADGGDGGPLEVETAGGCSSLQGGDGLPEPKFLLKSLC